MQMSAERNARIQHLLDKRQPDLTVCMEEVHKPHNVAAIVRSCDAVGIHQIHGVWNAQDAVRKGTAAGSNNAHSKIFFPKNLYRVITQAVDTPKTRLRHPTPNMRMSVLRI